MKIKKWLEIIMITIIVSLTVTSGLAGENEILPWGMSWDTSVRDTVDLLQTNLPGAEHHIMGTRGVYYVDAEVDQGGQRIRYRAEFKGGKASSGIGEFQLQDIENMNLKLHWVCISYEHFGFGKDVKNFDNSNVMKAFLTLYGQFTELYGQGISDGSYIETQTLDMKKRTYILPQRDGRIDFDAIMDHQRRYFDVMENSETYWLVVGNGHASCRLYVSYRDDIGGVRNLGWDLSFFFTKESQKNTNAMEALK